MCEVAGVNRGAYYKWKGREDSEEDQFNQKVMKDIQAQRKRDQTLGYRRMTIFLNRHYEKNHEFLVNKKRVYRLMQIMGMKSVIRRKKYTYKPSSETHTAKNVLNRNFKASLPNEKWLTDVTELKYGRDQKAYLSAILDMYDNRIVCYKLTRANNNELVFDTVNEALASLSNEHPLLHTDRGVQYTSYGFKRIVESAGLQHSMSRPGKCIDNGPMEGFWGTLKCEKYYLNTWTDCSFEQLAIAIGDYINYYNNERYQPVLGGLAPMECLALSA
ncbi:transposase [Virgibacillus phasianinus]|uniref:Transposase n=1 Tax=Virgibacillus phasianinus TaxID=2017483 RepID=A0A220U8U5_9BACI|nr:transposase [Virgibacillus phasianinus]